MKNIVLCFDGTENKFGPAPYTNPMKLFRLLAKDDPSTQICYYQPGIGASMKVESEDFFDRIGGFTNALDSAVAFTLDDHIKDAYKYLMTYYDQGDKIYMFGFRYIPPLCFCRSWGTDTNNPQAVVLLQLGSYAQ